MLKVWLLGKFEVRLDGVALQLPSRSEQSLLAYLMLNAGTAYRREKLAGLFWPDSDESNAKGYLRQALWRIRKALKDASPKSLDFFITNKLTIAFNGELEYWLDVAVLKKGDVRSIQALLESTSVYQGELLPGFYDEWVALERESVRALFERKMSTLVDGLLYERRSQEAIDQAERWISFGETPEPAYRGLMIAHAGLGEVSAAVAVYHRCVEALKKELDVEPSAETRVLYEKIRSGEQIIPALASQSIRGYELQAKIGEGSYGAVYRAFQKSVGREVAVKVILPQYANDPEFIRRFEVEAQIVAHLEHPHIVPLYDYWREPNGAYLVMRLLEGGSLETLLESGPVETVRAVDLVDQIAAGLALAHRQGVAHHDIKPANILLDEAGNAYLSDFGIAKVLGEEGRQTQAGGLFGTPTYVSPEQIRHLPVTPQSDIYSFGIVLYQMLTGKTPFADEDLALLIDKHLHQPLPSVRDCRPDLPVEVDQVIQCATAKAPAGRYPDTLALAAAFRRALSGMQLQELVEAVPAKDITIEVTNPYKGLRAFQESDADDFFGREESTQRLVARLGESGPASRFLAVVGPSGSGKSSLVKAGLIPALRGGALPGSESWFIVEMLPGSHPFEELEISLLRIASNPNINLMDQLQRDARGILRAARLALPSNESELLLVIDQFEEVFTLVEDPTEARQFMQSLYAAVTDPRSPVRVVITLRADFFDRPLMDVDLSTLLQDRIELVIPLTVNELERAIRSPAERVGVEVEPGLVTEMVAEVVEQPGALPLLQFALTELFERRTIHRLTLESYQSIGGVEGVLDQRAGDVFAGLGEAGKTTARQVFLRLVTLGEGVEDTRRRVLRSELEALENPILAIEGDKGEGIGERRQGVVASVLEVFGRARLLSFDSDPITRNPTVEIAHESLLREWGRLRGWLDESRGDVRMQRNMGSATAEWLKADRDPSFLLHGTRLGLFEGWAAETDLALTGEERLFLDASLAEREAQRVAEAARQRREVALERRSRNFLRLLVVVFLLAALGSLVLAWTAQKQADLATSRELAVMAINNLETDPERSILLALYALRTAYTHEAEDALHEAVQASRVRMVLPGHELGASSVEFSPDGTTIATASYAYKVTLWEASSGQKLFSLPGRVARYSPDGRRLVTGDEDGTVYIWDMATREKLLTLSGHHKAIEDVHFSPDGRLLESSSLDDSFIVWDTQTGEALFTSSARTGGFDTLYNVAFGLDGRLLLSIDFYSTDKIEWKVWGVDQNWAMLNQFPGYSILVFNPDGRWLAAPGGEQLTDILLWDLSKLSNSGLASLDLSAVEPVLVPAAHDAVIISFAFSRDETLLATSSLDGTAKIWQISPDGLDLLMTLSGHPNEVIDVAFSPDGARLATAGADGSVRIWDITPNGASEWFALAAHSDNVYRFSLTPDGKYLATASPDGAAKVWDMASKKELITITGHGGPLFGVAINQDGTQLATAGYDNIAKIWKLDLTPGAVTAELLHTLTGHAGGSPVGGIQPGLTSVEFSTDGTKLATGGVDNNAKVWDVGTGQELLSVQVDPDGGGATRLAFSPDGLFLATASDDVPSGISLAKVWEVASGVEISSFSLADEIGRIWGLAFSPDGKRVAIGAGSGTVKILDASTGQELLNLTGHIATVPSVYFSPDGKYLATSSVDGTARVWDAATGEELRVYTSPSGPLYNVAFTPDGKHLIASGKGFVYGYMFDLDELIRLAYSRLTRWFTPDECRQFLHREDCPSR